jgi:predicted amidohydrolase YtcJ
MAGSLLGCPCCGGAIGGLFEACGSKISAPDVTGMAAATGLLVGRRSFLAATITAAGLSAAPVAAAIDESPDDRKILFHGGTILTVDARFSQAEALAIRGNRILAVGSMAKVRKAAGPDATLVDLAGKVMLPGFIDAHSHVLTGALASSTLENVGAMRFPTADAVLAHLKKMVAATPPGEWVLARNYDPALQAGPDALTFAELDAISTEVPVFVVNASGHLAYANRKAFSVAGVPEDIANPPGAEFVRDAQGRLTGVMKNNVAFLKVGRAAPAMARAEPVSALIALLESWGKLGLTTVSELSLGTLTGSPKDAAILFAAERTGRLKARIRAYSFYTIGSAAWDEAGIKPGDGNAMARIAGYKLVADGSNQGFTGLQREPYVDSTSKGSAYMSPAELKATAIDRAGKGWPLALHGNGDAAIDNILDAVQGVRDAGIDTAKIRPRIEHCSMLHDEQITRMQALGVSGSFLIGHVHYWGVWMRDRVFGPRRVNLLGRLNSAGKAGVSVSIHSDFTVTDPNPLHMIEMAVTRRTWKEPDFILNPAERISVEAAIRAMTSEAAFQLLSDHEIGSLEAGKLADLVILEKDPRKVPVDSIKSINVLETWLDGRRVYAAA